MNEHNIHTFSNDQFTNGILHKSPHRNAFFDFLISYAWNVLGLDRKESKLQIERAIEEIEKELKAGTLDSGQVNLHRYCYDRAILYIERKIRINQQKQAAWDRNHPTPSQPQNGEDRLVPLSREKIEEGRCDIDRFARHVDYTTVEDLTYFREPILRDLFKRIYWDKEPDVLSLLDDAIERSGNSFRVQQVKEYVLWNRGQEG